MIVGFSSLAKLKAAILPDSLTDNTTWDTVLTNLGLAVVAAFDRHCNRVFERASGATYVRPADCSAVVVERYPLESISAAVILPEGSATTESVLDSISNFFPASGVIEFQSLLGTERDKLTITYTGGYWWDDSVAQVTAQPSGSTALPKDLVHAWQIQIQEIVERTRILKMGAVQVGKDGEYQSALSKLEMLPQVKDILRGYIRHA